MIGRGGAEKDAQAARQGPSSFEGRASLGRLRMTGLDQRAGFASIWSPCTEHRGDAMRLPDRRQFLHLATGAAALAASSRGAAAETWPARPVHYIVSSAAGGTQDILARLMAQWLSERLGQPFVIENRPGAGTNIATEMVARAAPDGYTLLSLAPANAINVTLYEHLSFNFTRDIAPVAGIMREPYVMLVHPSVPANTVAEFIALAKAG